MKRLRIIISLMICFTICFHFLLTPYFLVSAGLKKIVIIEDTKVRMRTGPSINHSIIVDELIKDSRYDYLATVNDEGGCDAVWYKVQYNSTTVGYICSQFASVYEINDNSDFPADYQVLIQQLQKKYPNWIFKPYYTGKTFEQVVTEQKYRADIENRTYINGKLTSSEGLRLTEPGYYSYYTDTYTPTDGTTWFAANKETIAYFMDPRNFINIDDIWMFEELSYNEEVHTREMIFKLFQGSDGEKYVDYIMNAAREYKVSPIHLASRIIQETMSGKSFTLAGTGGDYSCTMSNGTSYNGTGIYNFYNIGATNGECAAQRGLDWAAGNRSSDTIKRKYNLPWNTPEKGIMGGAYFIADGYINIGQDTLYFQKFNVLVGGNINHQYMTNVKAHYSETLKIYEAYKNINVFDEKLVFKIPVYSNMPQKTSLPPLGSPNNYLKTLTVDGMNIINFDGALTSYEVMVPALTTAVTLSGSTVNSNASVTGLGKIVLTGGETNVSIKVTAQNGEAKIYTIKIKKSSSSNITVDSIINKINVTVNKNYMSGINLGTTAETFISNISNLTNEATTIIKDVNGSIKTTSKLGTGDKIIITTGSETKEFITTIYGDINSDGNIDIVDLLRVQKYILGTSNLSEYFVKAADTNKDGNVDIVDLLRIQKHILGSISIQQ
ncbi:MAG TPA: hypothetical protein GX747_01965 [Tenericutes bacterium]|nr:hypothetical protein [Mycoplasmatota bacterium]